MKAGKLIPLLRLQGAPAEMSDEALLAAGAVGDPAALGALVDRHHLAAYRYLSRMTGAGSHELDDLVQVTFQQVIQSAQSYRSGAAVRTWILGIATNVARHHVRGEKRRRAALLRIAELPSRSPATPHEELDRRQSVRRLAAALEELPVELREAFLLCDVEESRGVDVAAALGIPEGTLYRRLHEARKALRLALRGGDRG
jgi:RNA polymerase sigma-70 factor (ECF subfamily)